MNWISVNHGIPSTTKNLMTRVLCAVVDGSSDDTDYGNVVVDCVYSKEKGFLEFYFGKFEPLPVQDKVTHWMYFPDPPKR